MEVKHAYKRIITAPAIYSNSPYNAWQAVSSRAVAHIPIPLPYIADRYTGIAARLSQLRPPAHVDGRKLLFKTYVNGREICVDVRTRARPYTRHMITLSYRDAFNSVWRFVIESHAPNAVWGGEWFKWNTAQFHAWYRGFQLARVFSAALLLRFLLWCNCNVLQLVIHAYTAFWCNYSPIFSSCTRKSSLFHNGIWATWFTTRLFTSISWNYT